MELISTMWKLGIKGWNNIYLGFKIKKKEGKFKFS